MTGCELPAAWYLSRVPALELALICSLIAAPASERATVVPPPELPREGAPDPKEPEPAAQPLESPPAPPARCRSSRSCVRMNAAGISVGSIGLAGIAAGVVLLVLPDEVDPDQPIYVSSTRPAGLVTLTLSAGVALTSVLMLIAARRGLQPRKRERTRVRLGPRGLAF